ncbi:MAG: response regulator [Coprococcus sp.]|nr:response regulator [Coprococcus sp.]
MVSLDQPEEKGLEEQLAQKQKRQKQALFLLSVVLLITLAAAGTYTFYQYLDGTLFQERCSHFVEISEQGTRVIESEVNQYRRFSEAAENILAREDIKEREDISDCLEEIQASLELEQSVLVAFDSSARLYTSDGVNSHWRDSAILSNGKKSQEIVTSLDYRGDDESYLLFIKQLDTPLDAGEGVITHVGVAVDIVIFQENFDEDIFDGESHVYVINQNGRRLYRHLCAGGFIDDYNLLSALEKYPFIHGGTLEDLREKTAKRSKAGYEFHYGEEPYFVAVSPVRGTDWTVLTFVPTKVLAAGTTAFINTAVVYVSAIAALVVLMLALLTFFFIAKRGDQLIIERQKEANRLLKEAADAANAASTAKSNFLSHMSHDIRTPINGIMGMTDIALKNMDNPDKILDCLRKIEGSSGHLLSLINDVLDMSRIESGKTKISREPMDIRQVISHCAAIVGGQIQGRDVELVEEFEEMSHPYVLGDELHLRQVLINILGNAVKFTLDGGKIYFRAGEICAEENIVRYYLEIEDTGIGMKPEFLPRIFEPFAQEDDGTRSTYKGTGLGMAITKQFIDLMGGTIRVESRLNEGSRFRVELPAEIHWEHEESKEVEQHKVNMEGICILLAEDNELNMEIAQYILEDEGIETLPATNGQEALKMFADSEPGFFDGILMDVMMPVMDGLSATRAIRALKREDAETIPIIAMTANAYDEDRRRCLEAGMNAHIAKPIDGENLIQILAQYIRPN